MKVSDRLTDDELYRAAEWEKFAVDGEYRRGPTALQRAIAEIVDRRERDLTPEEERELREDRIVLRRLTTGSGLGDVGKRVLAALEKIIPP